MVSVHSRNFIEGLGFPNIFKFGVRSQKGNNSTRPFYVIIIIKMPCMIGEFAAARKRRFMFYTCRRQV